MAKLFPYFIARTTGICYSELEEFNQMGLISLMSDIRKLVSEKNAATEKGCDLLYRYIEVEQDPIVRRQLLNAKRSLFKNGALNKKEIALVNEIENTDFVEIFNQHLTAIELIEDKIFSNKERFEQTIVANRIKFKNRIATNEQLRNGLLLSSLEITKILDQYTDTNATLPSKKEKSLEISLAKYFTRACTKPSPFSTFTTLSVGETHSKDLGVSSSVQRSNKIVSFIRYNNALFKIFSDLLVNYFPFYSKLTVRLNPSLNKNNDHYRFFINFHNDEAFQRVDIDPLLDWIVDLCEKGKYVYESLLEIISVEIQQDIETVDAYLQNLTNIGILEFCYPISLVTSGWEKDFANFLSEYTNDKILIQVTNDLKEMYNLRVKYEQTFDYIERRTILKQMHLVTFKIYAYIYDNIREPEEERLSMEGFFLENHEILTKSKKEEDMFFKRKKNIFTGVKKEKCLFEDTKLDTGFVIDKASSGKLETLLPLINNLSKSLLGKLPPSLLTQYFLEEYGIGVEVPLLDCYEQYQKKKKGLSDVEWSKLFSKKAHGDEGNGIEELLTKYLSDVYSNNLSKSDVINLDSKHLLHFIEQEEIKDNRKNSFSSFIQPVIKRGNEQELEDVKFVVNQWISDGYGKFFSRFLYLFDKNITNELVKYNISDTNGDIYCESGDGAIFNANLHPPLLHAEFNIPGGYNLYPHEKIIDIKSLTLCYNNETESVVLKHKNNEVSVFDLGFQIPAGRSLLFNFFYNFSKNLPTGNVLGVLLNSLYYKMGLFKSVGEEVFFPRIMIDDFLIIQRMQWRFYQQDLPIIEDKLSGFEKNMLVEDWRIKYRLPKKFFMRQSRDGAGSDPIDGDQKKKVFDDYKPVFIDFDNFLLVNVFIKMIVNVESYLMIEEALPGKDEFVQIDKGQFASEFLVQWYE